MLKWGIFGAGIIADKFANDFKAVNGAKIIAAYSRREERAKSFCFDHQIERAYSDEHAFFNDSDIDVVYVSTPHVLHAETAIKALRAGKHVLCEKPFAMNADEAKVVFDVAKEEGKFVMEALWTLFLPAVIQAHKWLESGVIGKVISIDASFGFSGNHNPEDRLLNHKLGGGALLDVGIYTVLIANKIAKDVPVSLKAIAKFTHTEVDETILISSLYDTGILASLRASIKIDMPNTLIISGENGQITLPRFWMADEAILTKDNTTTHFKNPVEDLFGYQYEAQSMCDAIMRGELESDVVPKSFTLNLMETLDRIRKEIGLVYS